MNIDLYCYSGIGGRPVNEDSYVTGGGYYVVSDGLGGHDNGELASGAVTRYISENINAADISNEHISSLILGANEAVKHNGEGGKATLAALFTDGNMIRLDNIGDSRVYYFRGGSIFFRTKDHSVCQASVDMGEMTDIDVRNSADRSGLFKVLGDSTPLKLPKPYELIEPINDDAFLICSDGFWEHIYEPEMEADLLKAQSAQDWLEHMLKRLLLRSENNGDNFTAICGIIRSQKTMPHTVAVPAAKPVTEIPRTGGITDDAVKHSMPLKSKIIIAACILIAAAAVIAMVILLATNKGGDSPDNSSVSASASESQSTEESTPDEGTEESTPDEGTEESTPDGETEESTPDGETEESTPDGGTEESAPDEGTEESTPDEGTEESAPSDEPEAPRFPIEIPEVPGSPSDPLVSIPLVELSIL